MFIFLKDSSSKCYLFERFLLQNVSFSKGPIFKMLPIQKVPSLKFFFFQTGSIFKMFPIQKVSFSNVQSSNCFLPKMFSIQSASHSKSSLVKVFLTHKIPSSKFFFQKVPSSKCFSQKVPSSKCFFQKVPSSKFFFFKKFPLTNMSFYSIGPFLKMFKRFTYKL